MSRIGYVLILVLIAVTPALAGPTDSPTATPTATSTATISSCLEQGVTCKKNQECCSNSCTGTRGEKTCQP